MHLYTAHFSSARTALRHGSHSFTCNYTNACLYAVSVYQMGPSSPDWGGGHLIAAYYSFIYPERMKGWVGLVGWSTVDCLPTYGKWSLVSCKSSARQGKFAAVKDQRSTTYHATTHIYIQPVVEPLCVCSEQEDENVSFQHLYNTTWGVPPF